MHPDERFIIGIESRSFYRHAVNRVWAIEHNNRDALLFARTHAQIHRPDERIIARADVLKVYEQTIEPVQHFCSRLAVLAVETVNRNTQTRVFIAFPLHHVVLRLTEEAMLRTKKRGKPKEIVVVPFQDSRCMFKP